VPSPDDDLAAGAVPAATVTTDPASDRAAPDPEQRTPHTEANAPDAEQSTPVAEQSAPVAEQGAPGVDRDAGELDGAGALADATTAEANDRYGLLTTEDVSRTGAPSSALADSRVDELITAYPSARPGPAGAIHGVGVTVLVTDLDTSVRFYRDVLGFFEIDSGPGSAVLASGDTRLVLRSVRELSPTTSRRIHLNLEVGDLEAVHRELREAGVEFVHGPRPVNRGGRLELWGASLHDPDGHNIAITQWRAIN
jgi:catechol 2,3-dioxygenase-like lactoylglutathione lyase family enzyme